MLMLIGAVEAPGVAMAVWRGVYFNPASLELHWNYLDHHIRTMLILLSSSRVSPDTPDERNGQHISKIQPVDSRRVTDVKFPEPVYCR